jgi:hypothetical protein
MRKSILTAGIILFGTAVMAQTTAPVTDKGNNAATDKGNNVSLVAQETESAKGKGEIVSAEAQKNKALHQSKNEKRAELKAANAAPRSEEAKATAETRKATFASKTDKARPEYARQGGASGAKSVRLARPVKPARPVKG